ncbi:MAG: hypothetical protein K6T26_08220, partial [Alicyclobacillus sp.]|nr:hypothetical protein [Alicyclobacillus sp.]
EETERQLCERIPKRLWSQAHHWLIHHGRRVCTARKPQCAACPLQSDCLSYAASHRPADVSHKQVKVTRSAER